jgi:tetratricopeptide (TPR) repeat protein
MEPLLRDLAGQQVQADHALLSFGQGSHLGDVTIGDVAGGNITKLSLRGDIVMGNKVLTFGLGIGAAIILTFGILSASVIFNIGPLSPIAQDVWQQFFPPFLAADEGESLIIVADFRDESTGQYTGSNPASFLYHSLADRVQRDGLDIRVERLYDVLDANTVRQTGEAYSATLVLWGEYNSGAVIPVLERIRLPERRLTDEEGAFLAIADPERVQIGELTNISATGSYITLYTLGADRYAAEEYDTARDYLTSAINAVPDNEAVTAQPDEAYFLRGNIAYWPEQDYQAAQRDYEAALELSPDYADALNNLGNVAESLGNYAEALEYHEQTLALFRDLGDRQGEANALGNLGLVTWRQGNYAAATEYSEQALVLFRDLGDRQGEASSLNNLGNVADSQGNYAEAREYYEQALALFRDLGDRQGEVDALNNLGGVADPADALNNLGSVADSQGNYAEVREYYEQALVLARELNYWQGEANALIGLGNFALNQGNYAAAIEYYEQALALARELGDREDEANALGGLGQVAEGQRKYAEALEYHEQALALFRDLGERRGEANALGNLGIVAFHQGNYADAVAYFEQALALFRDLGNTRLVAMFSWLLGLIYEAQGDLERAIPLMQNSIDFYAAIEHPRAAGDANRLCWNGSLGGFAEEVVDTCEQAVELATEQEEPFHVDSRGLNRALTGDTAGAIEDFQFFVEQLQDIEMEDEERASTIAEAIARREAWIAALEAGENSFDEETLEELRNE